MYKYLTWAERNGIMSKNNSSLGKEKILSIIKKEGARVYFAGVGGVGMSSLAILTKSLGIYAYGGDRDSSEYTEILEKHGISVSIGPFLSTDCAPSLIVYTLALGDDEVFRYAESYGIPTVSRAEYLGALMTEYINRIGVSGSHGKSTVTAMLEGIFSYAGQKPTVVSGAPLAGRREPFLIGEREVFIYEACEYKDSFLCFSPTCTVFTNVELDHVDYFKDREAIEASFIRAMNMPNLSVLNIDDPATKRLISSVKAPFVTYGESPEADFKISRVKSCGGYYSFFVSGLGGRDEIKLKVPGRFNVHNAAGAYALGVMLGVLGGVCARALSEFSGISRRLEYLGTLCEVPVYYDYAHHPTEIKKTVEALREVTDKKITVLFRPHTYTRTAYFIDEFAEALGRADKVYVMDISAIREKEILGVSSELLAKKIGKCAERITESSLIERITEQKDTAFLLMGAADVGVEKIKNIITRGGAC